MNLKLSMLVLAGFSSAVCHADDLVVGGTITSLTNTFQNQTSFAVKITGATTNLCGTNWIVFPIENAANVEAHNRAYAAALLAFAMNKPVRITNYSGSSCSSA